ncbi:hypothetical protein [Pseudoclavibacter sp. AY1H1]|uniref:hypothetical protein n=1 Tax=Pseudoclavibacter sp. AY1H1 TaxID=2080584 RepID=UPI0011B0B8B0|nr:hypothetical protein [Pseudoclavibacter sp. AY1H1]
MKFRESALGGALREVANPLWLAPLGVGAGVIVGGGMAGVRWPVFIVGALLMLAALAVLVLRWRRQRREEHRLAEQARWAELHDLYRRANVDESK